jgi:hypothetical protein
MAAAASSAPQPEVSRDHYPRAVRRAVEAISDDFLSVVEKGVPAEKRPIHHFDFIEEAKGLCSTVKYSGVAQLPTLAELLPEQEADLDVRFVLKARLAVIQEAPGEEILFKPRASQYESPVLQITEDFSRTWKQRITALTLLAVETQANAHEAEKEKKRKAAEKEKVVSKRAKVAHDHGPKKVRGLLPSHERGQAAKQRAAAADNSPPPSPPERSPEAAFSEPDAVLAQLEKVAK